MITLRRRTAFPSAILAMGAALLLVAVACTGEAPMEMSSNVPSEAAAVPETPPAAGSPNYQVLSVWVNRDGSAEVKGSLHPIEELSAVLQPLFDRSIVISFAAHEATPYRLLASVQDEVRAAGFLRVVFTTVASDAQRQPTRELSTLDEVGLRVVLPSPGQELRVVPTGPGQQSSRIVRGARGEAVQLEPAAGTTGAEPAEPRPPLTLEVRPTGRMLVHRGEGAAVEEVASADLESTLRRELAKNEKLIVLLRTHPDAAYGRMYDALGALQRAGGKRYSLQLAQ